MGNIPDPTTGKKFDYKPKVQEYLDKIPNTTDGLYLFGREYGHGKTSLAAIALKYWAKKGVYGYWINYKSILNIEFSNDAEKKRMWDSPVLVVDEFDLVESSDENSARKTLQFESLLRYRYGNETPTILTSNLNMTEDLVKKYPHIAGIRSVLSDCTIPISVYGKNWRKA